MPSLSDFTISSLEDLFASWSFPRANAARFLRHFYNSGGQSLDPSRLGPALFKRLAENVSPRSTTIAARRQAADGTIKLLIGVKDNVKSQISNVKSGESSHAERSEASGLELRGPIEEATGPDESARSFSRLKLPQDDAHKTLLPLLYSGELPQDDAHKILLPLLYSGEGGGEGSAPIRQSAQSVTAPHSDSTPSPLSPAPCPLPTAHSSPPAYRLPPTAYSPASTVECVLMPSHLPDRAAGCVSSQIGCAMGCDFCASTKSGVERSLTSGEIVEQFLWLRSEALKLGRRLQTLVFMGMGEPLLNYDNVVAAIRRIAGEDLGAIGWRHVTVSTVGIVPGIDRLREENLGMQLAVSLHAPDDDTRSAIIPTGRRYKVADILAAVQRYQSASGRVATIEYTLLEGINDSDAQAELLATLLNTIQPARRPGRESRMHVNLIPYNWIGPGVSGREYRRPSEERMIRFLTILRERQVVAHFRRTRGDDIDGACGQLRERVAQS